MVGYLQDLNHGLHRMMKDDPAVHVLGEDLLDPYGGAFKVEKGLSTNYPDRVHTTPISEAGFVGLATGMALRGLKPVVAIMFGDFLTLTFDQFLNHMVKFPTMYGKPLTVPVVVRTPMGGGRGYGATHSQSIEKYFLGMPGLRVVAPSHVHSPGSDIYATLGQTTPTLFIEHKQLYGVELFSGSAHCHVETASSEAHWPTKIVRNFSSGEPDLVVASYGGMSRILVQLLEDWVSEEVKISLVLPSEISNIPLAALVRETKRCGRLMIVEDGTAGFGWGAEVSAGVYDAMSRSLLTPIRRVAAKPSIIPCCHDGEMEAMVGREEIEAALMDMMA